MYSPFYPPLRSWPWALGMVGYGSDFCLLCVCGRLPFAKSQFEFILYTPAEFVLWPSPTPISPFEFPILPYCPPQTNPPCVHETTLCPYCCGLFGPARSSPANMCHFLCGSFLIPCAYTLYSPTHASHNTFLFRPSLPLLCSLFVYFIPHQCRPPSSHGPLGSLSRRDG